MTQMVLRDTPDQTGGADAPEQADDADTPTQTTCADMSIMPAQAVLPDTTAQAVLPDTTAQAVLPDTTARVILDDTPVQASRRRTLPGARLVPGLALVLALAVAGRLLAGRLGILPDVVLAMLGGIALNNALPLPAAVQPGVKFTLRYLLRAAIILLGAGLSVAAVLKTGAHTLVLIVVLVTTAMALGLLFARLFRLSGVVGILIGAGTAICGGTAILALSPLVRAKDEETAYAIATIFTFNIMALLAYPEIGHLLHLTQTAFGSWAGTAVNDTSVVVATGYVFGHAAGAVATVVKLTRTVLLVPLAVVVGLAYARKGDTGGASGARGPLARAARVTPWFVLGFLAMAALNSAGAIPHAAARPLSTLAGFLIVMVLGAVGLSVDLRAMRRLGARPLLVGLLLAAVMGLLSLTLIHVLAIA